MDITSPSVIAFEHPVRIEKISNIPMNATIFLFIVYLIGSYTHLHLLCGLGGIELME